MPFNATVFILIRIRSVRAQFRAGAVGKIDILQYAFDAFADARCTIVRLRVFRFARRAQKRLHALAVFCAPLGVKVQREIAGEARADAEQAFQEEFARQGAFRMLFRPYERMLHAVRKRFRKRAVALGMLAGEEQIFRAVEDLDQALPLPIVLWLIQGVDRPAQVDLRIRIGII